MAPGVRRSGGKGRGQAVVTRRRGGTPAPGLAAPVAVHRKTAYDVFCGFAWLVALIGAYALLRGADLTDPDPVLLLLVVGGPAVIALSGLRDELAAGPGWFRVRGHALISSPTWVRSDRLVHVDSAARGTAVYLRFRDEEGRQTSIEAGALASAPAVVDQLESDVRRSLARTGPDGEPLLDMDWRARMILLGDAPPPVRERFRRRKKRG